MRLRSLILWDVKFQIKYGFYFLYCVLTVLYTLILLMLPEGWRSNVATILIFSDPGAMGLFFMGAIVLLEKSQRVPCGLAVSSVREMEYILSKVFSLAFITVLVALALWLSVGEGNLVSVLVGTFLTGVIFTLAGIIVATKISSINQFLLWTVPVEIIGFGPALLHWFKVGPDWLWLYPTSCGIDLIGGRNTGAGAVMIMMISIGILLRMSYKSVKKMWMGLGGIQL